MKTWQSRRRRIDVLNDIRSGMSQKEIAEKLGVSASRAHKLYKEARVDEQDALLRGGAAFDTPEGVLYETEMLDGAEIDFDLRERSIRVGGVRIDFR